jgi:acylphosphatase
VIRRRVTVHGRVQSVGFRVFLARRARGLGVAGWVRNRSDGTVEAVFEGEPDAVDSLVGLSGEGPRGAAVSEVDVFEEAPEGLAGFEVE